MNPEQLKAYKREKSRQFNAKSRELRLKEKTKNQTDTIDKQDDRQDDNRLDDMLVKIEQNHSSKIDELLNNVDELLETKFDEMLNKLNIIENKIGTKSQTNLDTIIETKPLRFKPIVFA